MKFNQNIEFGNDIEHLGKFLLNLNWEGADILPYKSSQGKSLLLLSSADKLCKHFGPRSGLTEGRS